MRKGSWSDGIPNPPTFSSLKNGSFWFRCMYMLLWGKFVLYKYVTCWLVTVRREGWGHRPAGG